MSSNSRNDDFPTIRLDDEDRRDYQKKQSSASAAAPSHSSTSDKQPAKTKSSGGSTFVLTLSLLIALGASGGCYFLYDLSQKQQVVMADAERRIEQLENKLSATGEEIGESTVALQVKVTELSNKTNELWEQMDKLWASAWRRNQKEISDLSEKVDANKANVNESISQVARNADQQKTQLSALQTQLSAVADDLLALNVRMEQTSELASQFGQSKKVVNDKLALLEQRNNSLSSRIGALENEIREMATQLVSQPASTPAGSPE